MEEKADLGPLTDTVTSANKMRNLETVSGLAGIEASPRELAKAQNRFQYLLLKHLQSSIHNHHLLSSVEENPFCRHQKHQ